MKRTAIALALGILLLVMGMPDASPQTTPAKEKARISGRVTDFAGRPVQGAAVELKNSRFDNVASAASDKDGRYALTVPKGIYMALAAVKDYQVTVDGQSVAILQLSKVREASGPDQSLIGYVIQVALPPKAPATEYVPITIALLDRATGEKGEGCLFFRPAQRI